MIRFSTIVVVLVSLLALGARAATLNGATPALISESGYTSGLEFGRFAPPTPRTNANQLRISAGDDCSRKLRSDQWAEGE